MGTGTGIGIGIGEGLHTLAQRIRERKAHQHQEKTEQGNALLQKMRDVATNIWNDSPKDEKGQVRQDSPVFKQGQAAFQQVLEQYKALYPDPKQRVSHLKRFFTGGGEKQPPMPTLETEMAAAPHAAPASTPRPTRVGDPYQKGGQGPYYIAEMTESGEVQERKMPESFVPQPGADDMTPIGKPFPYFARNYQRFRDKSGKISLKEYPGPIEPEKVKAPIPKFNATTGGLYSIEDADTGVYYTSSNIKQASPEIQRMWADISGQTEAHEKKEEAARKQRFDESMKRMSASFQNSLAKLDYAGARKSVNSAHEELRSAEMRKDVMHKNLDSIRQGNQQAALSMIANHIGMTLGAQKGARITRAVWEEAMDSTPWLAGKVAKFFHQDENGDYVFDGWRVGVTITDDQARQMVELADEKVDLLRGYVGKVESDYSDALSAKNPKDLKNKVNNPQTQGQGEGIKIIEVKPVGP